MLIYTADNQTLEKMAEVVNDSRGYVEACLDCLGRPEDIKDMELAWFGGHCTNVKPSSFHGQRRVNNVINSFHLPKSWPKGGKDRKKPLTIPLYPSHMYNVL